MEALHIRRAKANDDSCLKSADTLYNIAIVYMYANSNFDDKYMYERALEKFQQCLETYHDAGLADDHPSIKNATQWVTLQRGRRSAWQKSKGCDLLAS